MRGTHKWHRHHRDDRLRRGANAGSFRRRFLTRDERIARLETYLGELRAEAQAVEERLARLQAVRNS